MQEISEILEVNALLAGLSQDSTKSDLLAACAEARGVYPALGKLDSRRTRAEILEQIHAALVDPLQRGGRRPATSTRRSSVSGERGPRSSEPDREYLQALWKARMRSHQQWRQATEHLGQAQREIHAEAGRRLARAYGDYTDSLRGAWGKENAEELARKAWDDYCRVYAEEGSSVRRKCATVFLEYSQALRATWKEASGRDLEARRAWVAARE